MRLDVQFFDRPEEEDRLLDASQKIAIIYADMLDTGMSQESIGRAMIGATIHLYDALGQIDQLPTIFRRAARNVEIEFSENPPIKN